MRILLLGVNYAPEVTGIGPYTTELAEHLAACGHEVAALTAFPYYPQWRIDPAYTNTSAFTTEVINGVRVTRCPVFLPNRPQSAFRRVLFDSSIALTTLIASVRSGKTQVVICISPPLQLGITAWLIARTRGARLILHLQDLVPDAALSVGMMKEGALTGISRRLERFVYARSERITVISQGFHDNLSAKGIPSSKLELLPNWVKTQRFRVTADPTVRADLGAREGETLVVHAGNMGAKQGLETVLDAAAELSDEQFVLTLIGDGTNRAALEARAARLHVRKVNFRPLQTDFPATLAAADVLVLAQRGEVVDSVAPSKLLGYMASGKPVVAAVNEKSEAGRLIKEAGCGLVVPPERPAALAAALRDLRAHPKRRRAFGEAGRRYAEVHFETRSILQRWQELVEAEGAPRP